MVEERFEQLVILPHIPRLEAHLHVGLGAKPYSHNLVKVMAGRLRRWDLIRVQYRHVGRRVAATDEMECRRGPDRAAASDHDDLCVLAICCHGVFHSHSLPTSLFSVDRSSNGRGFKLGLIYSELYETGNLSGG